MFCCHWQRDVRVGRHRSRLELELLRLLTKPHDAVLKFQLSFLMIMNKKLETSGVLQLVQSVSEMSCLWLPLSSVLHPVVVPPNVVLFVAMIEVAWDSVSRSRSWCASK